MIETGEMLNRFLGSGGLTASGPCRFGRNGLNGEMPGSAYVKYAAAPDIVGAGEKGLLFSRRTDGPPTREARARFL